MQPSDSLGFEPRYFNFSDIERPSDISNYPPLERLLEELPFWEIVEESRSPIYCAINGVVLHHSSRNKEEYTHLINRLCVEMPALDDFTRAIDERYSRFKQELDERSVPNSDVISFSTITQEFCQQIAGQSDNAETSAWCGVFFAMGLHGSYTGTRLCADLLAQWEARHNRAESYLYQYVLTAAVGADHMNEETPMNRFLSSCYRSTSCEQQFVVKRVLPEVSKTISEDSDEHSLAQIFMRCHKLAAQIALEEPDTLQRLLFDIEDNIRPGIVEENLNLVERVVGKVENYPWKFSELWNGGREMVKEQYPTVIPCFSGNAPKLARLSYFQQMVDFAIWAAFVGVAPDAFRNFDMGAYSELSDSAPEAINLN